ncbi:unnamed protein product [Clavelina lepadiformis]|uniref:Uncharacterized protein n=1 Tax=Clavelina lepadiformis TaxID=159417 RepID=A0ABP0GUW7_CLALP
MEQCANDTKVVLVTGASSGIGAAIVKNFVENGIKVVGCARNLDTLEEIAADINVKGAGTFPEEIEHFDSNKELQSNSDRSIICWRKDTLMWTTKTTFTGLTIINVPDPRGSNAMRPAKGAMITSPSMKQIYSYLDYKSTPTLYFDFLERPFDE